MANKLWVKAFIEGSDGKPFEIGSTGVYEDLPEEAKTNVIAKVDEWLSSFKAPDAPVGGESVAPDSSAEDAAPPT